MRLLVLLIALVAAREDVHTPGWYAGVLAACGADDVCVQIAEATAALSADHREFADAQAAFAHRLAAEYCGPGGVREDHDAAHLILAHMERCAPRVFYASGPGDGLAAVGELLRCGRNVSGILRPDAHRLKGIDQSEAHVLPAIGVRLLEEGARASFRAAARGLPLVTPALLVDEFANMGAHFDALLDAASAPAALLAAAVLAHSSYAAGAYAHAGLWGALERASDAELRAASAAADASLLARHVHPLDSLAHVIADLYVSLYGAEWEAPSGLESCRVEHEKGSAGSAGSFTGWSRADGRWYSRMAYCQPRPGGPWGRDEPDGAVDGEHSARAAQCVRLARAESLAAALGADAGGTVHDRVAVLLVRRGARLSAPGVVRLFGGPLSASLQRAVVLPGGGRTTAAEWLWSILDAGCAELLHAWTPGASAPALRYLFGVAAVRRYVRASVLPVRGLAAAAHCVGRALSADAGLRGAVSAGVFPCGCVAWHAGWLGAHPLSSLLSLGQAHCVSDLVAGGVASRDDGAIGQAHCVSDAVAGCVAGRDDGAIGQAHCVSDAVAGCVASRDDGAIGQAHCVNDLVSHAVNSSDGRGAMGQAHCVNDLVSHSINGSNVRAAIGQSHDSSGLVSHSIDSSDGRGFSGHSHPDANAATHCRASGDGATRSHVYGRSMRPATWDDVCPALQMCAALGGGCLRALAGAIELLTRRPGGSLLLSHDALQRLSALPRGSSDRFAAAVGAARCALRAAELCASRQAVLRTHVAVEAVPVHPASVVLWVQWLASPAAWLVRLFTDALY